MLANEVYREKSTRNESSFFSIKTWNLIRKKNVTFPFFLPSWKADMIHESLAIILWQQGHNYKQERQIMESLTTALSISIGPGLPTYCLLVIWQKSASIFKTTLTGFSVTCNWMHSKLALLFFWQKLELRMLKSLSKATYPVKEP